ncbi:MAG: HigA family addiction module antidote protein [Phycisphaerae bacterium]|nr:HigA family addiction module antidote protein [Phycisphaerae bacterium]
MAKAFKPAEVFHPGEFLRDELIARGWTQSDLARVIGRPLQTVNEIILGKKRVTAATAKALGSALGTGPEIWINLQTAYDLFHAPEPDPAIERRAAAMA